MRRADCQHLSIDGDARPATHTRTRRAHAHSTHLLARTPKIAHYPPSITSDLVQPRSM